MDLKENSPISAVYTGKPFQLLDQQTEDTGCCENTAVTVQCVRWPLFTTLKPKRGNVQGFIKLMPGRCAGHASSVAFNLIGYIHRLSALSPQHMLEHYQWIPVSNPLKIV